MLFIDQSIRESERGNLVRITAGIKLAGAPTIGGLPVKGVDIGSNPIKHPKIEYIEVVAGSNVRASGL